MAIDWPQVLAVYAVKTNNDPLDPEEVVTFNDKKLDKLRKILNEMNSFTFSIASSQSHERTLTVNISTLSAAQMADAHHFSKAHKEQLNELLSGEYADLWAQLLGGFVQGSGEILQSDAGWVGTGIFAWPMQAGYRISSGFGLRDDPLNPGTTKLHTGVDIAAPLGTPILAAADGVITVANSTDSYGFGWGYHIKIEHSSGLVTLYAHCSKIAVRVGEAVKTGQVIGFVGSTGNSTGPHLHFQVYQNGVAVDPMQFFTAK
jgi:murein DD-endopeptidase MepM/ murein hydrolase activator NlpD